ncbi:DNA polymerase III subunit delta [Acetobacter nitrogenifigens DSM 23921 = NBRC 105050]|uniref:DNA-directed DNA polymerase n=1 Tax=Acetobacter nitrogenifigens DSM 23921 = NBRC 105050 TaxID=1120919 RepID=A0A511X9G6_9PROT|nr:DNA polymerase III subunit delta [Acetobacter nitrogenifigens DSM 23921 = NBRC 105050]GEN59590.1 DNA polymerase III subunit delta [Acetobacter nitrogenifigens DSM 23921 = NBRC 105050]
MVKIDARALGRVLHSPSDWRAILLHGEDAGLIREYAANMTRAVAGSLDDPFRVATLSKESHERLEEEATALSLDGGRRVVWVRDATDALAAPLGNLLEATAESLIIVEGGVLAARSKLRALVENAPSAASIGCYPEEGRALEASVSRMFQEQGVAIDGDALAWLTAHLGPDRVSVRGEVEKLTLYAGAERTLSLHDVQQCAGDSGSSSMEDAVFAAMEGDRASSDFALERALEEGASPVAIARVMLSHIGRLRLIRATMEQGRNRADAIKTLRPPVFFKRAPSFNRALDVWSLDGLSEIARRTQEFELSCKQTGAMDTLLCRRHLAAVAARAASGARRR